MSDEREVFLEMLGHCCDRARGMGTQVVLEFDDGRSLTGVPQTELIGQPGEEVDDTGVQRLMRIADEVIEVADVTSYRVLRPA